MSLTIELTPEQETVLQEQASTAGLEASEYARQLLENDLAERINRTYTASELLQMPATEGSRSLRAATELAAPEYERDLGLSPRQRELTAISAIAGRDFMEQVSAA